ncbi:MAG: hypothetical protein ACE14S_11240 [Candidatus Bathyarchaeia archaeon]
MKLNKTDEAVLAALQPVGTELTLAEIAEKSGQPGKKVFRSLRKLFEAEVLDSNARKYRIVNLAKASAKASGADESGAEEE